MTELYQVLKESDRRQLTGFFLLWLIASWVPGEAVLTAVPCAYDHTKGRSVCPGEVNIPNSRKLKHH